ncbi:flightin [Copidosoma floridanum]|uniref:flightin n=1 Tax=Copidosoma floridanum TaxID=29053 RepID=UPI0006C9BEF5|nr:flightin [Copidosoma floridanum]
MSWADEEAAPWDAGSTEETTTGTEGESSGTEGFSSEGGGPPPPPPFDFRVLPRCDPPKYTLHWVRPLFLNYGYLYDYRQNYYNDVIDWMNKRNKGISRETPRAQEWSERAMRTYDQKNKDKSRKGVADMNILRSYKPKVRHYSYHTRAYYSLKYQKIL